MQKSPIVPYSTFSQLSPDIANRSPRKIDENTKGVLSKFMDPVTLSTPEETKKLYDYIKDGKNITTPGIIVKISADQVKQETGFVFCFITVYLGTPRMAEDIPGILIDVPIDQYSDEDNGTEAKKNEKKVQKKEQYHIKPHSTIGFLHDGSGSEFKVNEFVEVSQIEASIHKKYVAEKKRLEEIVWRCDPRDNSLHREKLEILNKCISFKAGSIVTIECPNLSGLLCEETISLSAIELSRPSVLFYRREMALLDADVTIPIKERNQRMFDVKFSKTPIVLNSNVGFILYDDHKAEAEYYLSILGRCAAINEEFKSWRKFCKKDPGDKKSDGELKLTYELKWAQYSLDEGDDPKYVPQIVNFTLWKEMQQLSRVVNVSTWRYFLGPWFSKYVPFFAVLASDIKRENENTLNIKSLDSPEAVPVDADARYMRFFNVNAFAVDIVKALKTFAFRPSKDAILSKYPNSITSPYYEKNMHSTVHDIVLLEEWKCKDLKGYLSMPTVTPYVVVCIESSTLTLSKSEWEYMSKIDSKLIDLFLYNEHFQKNITTDNISVLKVINDPETQDPSKVVYKEASGSTMDLEYQFYKIVKLILRNKISKFTYLVNDEVDEKKTEIAKDAIDIFTGRVPMTSSENMSNSQLLAIDYPSQQPSQTQTNGPRITEISDENVDSQMDITVDDSRPKKKRKRVPGTKPKNPTTKHLPKRQPIKTMATMTEKDISDIWS
jgi:hypothetical protein